MKLDIDIKNLTEDEAEKLINLMAEIKAKQIVGQHKQVQRIEQVTSEIKIIRKKHERAVEYHTYSEQDLRNVWTFGHANNLQELADKMGRTLDSVTVQFSRMRLNPTRLMKKVLRKIRKKENGTQMGNKKHHIALTMTEIETIWKEHRNGNSISRIAKLLNRPITTVNNTILKLQGKSGKDKPSELMKTFMNENGIMHQNV